MKVVFLSILFTFSITFLSNSKDSLFVKGLDEMLEENYEAAQNNFHNDVLKSPSFSSYYNLGVASGGLEEWSKAKWAFESALKYKPLNGDAQFNAEFVTQKLSPKYNWTHPYPWFERVILGFGVNLWLFAVIITSVFLAILVYRVTSNPDAKSTLNKWCLRLLGPALVLFLISFYGIYATNKHYTQKRFAIVKDDHTPFFISPNGVEASDNVDPGSRLKIIKFFKDDTWVQVKSDRNELLWAKSDDLYTY